MNKKLEIEELKVYSHQCRKIGTYLLIQGNIPVIMRISIEVGAVATSIFHLRCNSANGGLKSRWHEVPSPKQIGDLGAM